MASATVERAQTRVKGAPRRPKRAPRRGYLGVLAWAIGLLFFAPVAWMVLTSLHSEADAAANPPALAASLRSTAFATSSSRTRGRR